MPNVVQYVGHRPAHILVYNRQGRQGVYTGWTKKFEKISTFHHFETLRPYISETIKIEAYKQRTEKSFISLYPTVACIWTHRSWGSTG